MNAVYFVNISAEPSQFRCIIYRAVKGLPKLVTMTRASTARQAVKLARREVRAARKCGGLKG